jgi:hypothetical protein
MATSKAPNKVASDGQQTIEQLQQRFTLLNTQKIQAETRLKDTNKELERLKSEAREKYGTDDLVQLRAKLQEMKDDNEKKRAEYQAELERIEGELVQVEQKFQPAESAVTKDVK